MFRNKQIKQQLAQADQLKLQNQEYQRVMDGVEARTAEVQMEIDQLGMSATRLDRSLTKVVDYAKNTKEKQVETEEHVTQIEEKMDGVQQVFADVQQAYSEKQEYIERQQAGLAELQDQSKHYTGLSKKVADISSKDGESISDLIASVKELRTFVIGIGNYALQSAIDAGRMGEDGTPYIRTAEEIRCMATEFADRTDRLQQGLETLQEQSKEMDAQMHSFISLLKENTVSLGKIAREATKEKEKALPDTAELADSIVEAKAQLADLHADVRESKQKQELIMEEMENIGTCYMEQQDSTAAMEEMIGNIKRMLSNIDLNEKINKGDL